MLSDKWKVILGLAMKNYFKSYRKRFPGKSYKDAINATRNWVEGYIKKMYEGQIDEETSLWIENTLNKILMENS